MKKKDNSLMKEQNYLIKERDMFYSRRLQDDLLNASKVTGRTKKGLGVAILNAITNKTDENPLTNYNVMILDQSLKMDHL